ncbi:putative membrane protein [Sulfurihydrogenibium azorense Az-Fu1]|uniref:Putative membrane protein n=1 Tax=Sulfurihydrogenibium azorense (strain DSM 15241 / OCM 825 / Az-Fu1) TaxID=204536 RepID=C1DU01_SULAA|nr:iron export ABC transporter permease subunit FetB [Sulfurihydrogenibium azorense]ACN98754.1 putative membrane protein [Sulfurihydrogenibium azorense Az-Fu1]
MSIEYKFLFAYVLILISIYISYKEKIGLEKEILINSIRAFIQLLILGYALIFILKLSNVFELFGILFVMIVFAVYTAVKRVSIHDGVKIAFLSIFLSSFIIIGTLVLTNVLSLKANEIIPIGGMIIGNSLNAYTQTIERFKSDVKNNVDLIENLIALGLPLKEAFRFQIKNSIKAALIPILNNLQTLGIIWIPGITAGMVLAGANPIHAVFFQLVIMFSMVAVAVLTSYFATNLSYKKILWSI